MTFWKRQNYGDSKKVTGCQGSGGVSGGMSRSYKEDFYGRENTLYITIMEIHGTKHCPNP